MEGEIQEEPAEHLMDIAGAPTITHFYCLPLQAGGETVMTMALRWLHGTKTIQGLWAEYQKILTSFYYRTTTRTLQPSPGLQILLSFGTPQQSCL